MEAGLDPELVVLELELLGNQNEELEPLTQPTPLPIEPMKLFQSLSETLSDLKFDPMTRFLEPVPATGESLSRRPLMESLNSSLAELLLSVALAPKVHSPLWDRTLGMTTLS